MVWVRGAFFGTVASALLVGASVAQDPSSDQLKYSGSLDINQTRVSFLVSGNGGGGTLHFRGQDYPFRIGGLGVGGIGVTKLTATGEVYNMMSTTQFPGVYTAVRTGFAVGDQGSGKLWLKNGNGVVLRLRGDNKGVGLTLGADAVHISFK